MEFELKAGTDAAQCVVFDPVAVKRLLDFSMPEMFENQGAENEADPFHTEMQSGNLFHYYPASDGGYTFRFYIDEDPPEELLGSAISEESDRLLRIPSGRLCADGAEYLPQKEMEISDISEFKVSNLGQETIIPPGNYRVDASNFFTFEPGKFSLKGCLGSFMILGGVIGFIFYLFVIKSTNVANYASFMLLEIIGFYLILKNPGTPPQAKNGKIPDAVFVLKRINDNEDISQMEGGSLSIWPPKPTDAEEDAGN